MTFIALPVKAQTVSPNYGGISGQTKVTISGINFVNTSEILINFIAPSGAAVNVTGNYIDSQTLECITPNMDGLIPANSAVTLHVALNGQQFGESTAVFNYYGMFCTLIAFF